MQRWRGVTLGPVALPEGRLELRTPRLSDGPAWSRARLANRQWLERAFPAWGDDWAAEQSETAWAERWWPLRRAALAGRAMPFVLLLDGHLIGEIGVDAVDGLSNSGEASVWMVRDHGSADVMHAASLLLIAYSFTAPRPIDRLISPVATAARNGRSAGLSAVGLRIEATITRKVAGRGMVEHDIWAVHNTADTRTVLASSLAGLRRGERVSSPPVPARAMLVPALRMTARRARTAVRLLRATPSPERRSALGDVLLHPVAPRPADPASWRRDRSDRRRAPRGMSVERILRGGVPVGSVWTRADPGTAHHEIVASIDPGVDAAVLRSALDISLLGVGPGMRAVVRVPCAAAGRRVPDEAMLRDLGLTLVTTFAGNPEATSTWAGEQWWELIS